MAAQENRAVGRPREFSNHEELQKACDRYFAFADNNPWNRVDFKGKDATKVEIPTARPYTIASLCVFIGVTRKTWYNYTLREEFLHITTRVEDRIHARQLEGAAVGAYNSSIVARQLGLADKKEVKHEEPSLDETKILKLTPEERMQLIELNRKARATD